MNKNKTYKALLTHAGAMVEAKKMEKPITIEKFRELIENAGDLQSLQNLRELFDEINRLFCIHYQKREKAKFLEWRGIKNPCPACHGSGILAYPDTAGWRGGPGWDIITNDVCHQCWGSGDRNRTGANLRILSSLSDECLKEMQLKLAESEEINDVSTASIKRQVNHPS